MPNRERSDNVMIFDCDVHMVAKVADLDAPPQVCSLQLTKSRRSDWARNYHQEVTQAVQAGFDQRRLAHCKIWVQFGMPMWDEDENVGYAHLEASQKAHAEVPNLDFLNPEDNLDEAELLQHDGRYPQKSMQVRVFEAGNADEDKLEASQAPNPKKARTKAAAERKQTTLTQPQGVKTTLSLPDLGTAVGSTARSRMFAVGLKKKKNPT